MGKALINIDVNDLDLAISFYVRSFDLKVAKRLGSDAVELTGLGTPIYLLLKEENSTPFEGATEKRRYSRHWTPVHLDIVVDSIDIAVQKARDAGALIETEIQDTEWGKIALMSDPFGNGFCLIEFTARGYDALGESSS